MNMVYVDSRRYELLGLKATVKLKDRRTGEVATTRDGRTKQELAVFAIDRLTGESSPIKITIVAEETPTIIPGQPVEIVGLRAIFWETGGRSGLAYSADEIRPVRAREHEAS